MIERLKRLGERLHSKSVPKKSLPDMLPSGPTYWGNAATLDDIRLIRGPLTEDQQAISAVFRAAINGTGETEPPISHVTICPETGDSIAVYGDPMPTGMADDVFGASA